MTYSKLKSRTYVRHAQKKSAELDEWEQLSNSAMIGRERNFLEARTLAESSHLAQLASGLDILKRVGHADLDDTRDSAREHGLPLVLRLQVCRRSHIFCRESCSFLASQLPTDTLAPQTLQGGEWLGRREDS